MLYIYIPYRVSVFGYGYRIRTPPLSMDFIFTKLHWLPIKSRIIYKIALTIHLATHHNTPDYLANLLTPNTTIYEQRHINKFKLKTPVLLHLTSSQHKSFSIHAPKIWNDLPHHIRSIDSTVTFKSKLKTYLFAQ